MPTWNASEARDRTIRAILAESGNDPNKWASVANLIKSGAEADSGRSISKALQGRDAKGQYLFPSQDPSKAGSVPAISADDPVYQRAGALADTIFGGPAPAAPGAGGGSNTAILGKIFTDRGVSPQAAAGAIAGMMGESGANLDPTAFNTKDPHGGAGGIAQWNGPRLIGPTGMLAFARSQGVDVNPNVPTDAKKVPFAVQAAFLGHELDGPYSGVLKGLQVSNNGQTALAAWVNNFEDPKDKIGAINQRSQYVAPVTATLQRGDAAGPASSAAPAAAASAPVPAASAQPASAVAPGSSGGKFAVPPGSAPTGGAYPGSDKVSLVQSMTTGTSHNPQITTAANWGNLFGGGGAPAPPPATAPAAAAPVARPGQPPLPVAPPGSPLTPVPTNLGKDAPIGANGPTMPFLSPPSLDSPAAPAAPAPAPPVLPSMSPSPTPSNLPAPGTNTPYSDDNETPAQMPGGGGRRPAWTPGQPSMGFPAQQNPFGQPQPDQNASLPGSMFASAQNLLKLLFPNQTG